MNIISKIDLKVLSSIALVYILLSCNASNSIDVRSEASLPKSNKTPDLVAKINSDGNTITVYRSDSERPLLTQNAGLNFRPYIHPIISPDGNGVITEYSPSHHKHQTGLYWGFKGIKAKLYLTEEQEQKYKSITADFSAQVNKLYEEFESGDLSKNDAESKYKELEKDRDSSLIGFGIDPKKGRDYFHHPTKNFYGDSTDYWKRKNLIVLRPKSSKSDKSVKWRTVYDLLDEHGETLITETLTWIFRDENNSYFIDLQWEGLASKDVTIEEHEYSPLFLRMPWREDRKSVV